MLGTNALLQILVQHKDAVGDMDSSILPNKRNDQLENHILVRRSDDYQFSAFIRVVNHLFPALV